jgi:hypothetical protein
MMRRVLALFALSIAAACVRTAMAQSAGDATGAIPSKDEILELLSKADQKVSEFENAIKAAKPRLESVDPKGLANYSDVASTAHVLIGAMRKNGPTSYGLLGIVVTIDDLSLGAAQAVLSITLTRQHPGGVPVEVHALLASKNATHDISELIFHAAFRYMRAQEALLEKIDQIIK